MKMENLQCSLIVVFILFSIVSFHATDGDDTKTIGINDPRPFRMNKINLMWEKAKKMLDSSQLPALYAEFVVQDRLEADWKKRKTEGFDEDGELEAVVRHKFIGILDKFGLRAVYPDDHPRSNKIDIKMDKMAESFKKNLERNVFDEALKSDPKLAQLWEKAEQAGFSGQELDMLRTEFGHVADKVDEYQQLKRELTHLGDMSHNSVERFKAEEDNELGGDDNVKAKHSTLKSIFQDLKQSYGNLERMTEELLGQNMEKPREFVDPRVRELWKMALQSNLTDEELTSFRTELGHFETRVNKHEFFEKEAEMSRANLHMRGKVNDEDLPDEHIKLDQKVQEHAFKVKKWYTELKSRLLKGRPHAEL